MSFIEIKNLVVKYKTSMGFVYAVDNLNLEIENGTITGLVGESGSGKTTLGLTLLRILPLAAVIESGEILVDGIDILKLSEDEMAEWRGNKISMVFQGAMNYLNPLITIEEQVAEPLLIHEDISMKEAIEVAHDKLALVGLGENVWKRFPHELSGGMRQRAVIAMAIITNPKVLIADEPTTALDVITQARIMKLITSLQREFNLTSIIISHDLPMISEVADRIVVMYGGKISEIGSNEDILKAPKHPYTQGLLSSIPDPKTLNEIVGISGEPISLLNPPDGCRFYNRCSSSREICKKYDYKRSTIAPGHIVYCNLYGDATE
ncbi:MAG: ABC transporter ATP-binding protein [Candidatus Parvarchaeota archaeon]